MAIHDSRKWHVAPDSYGLDVVDAEGRTICVVDQRKATHPAVALEGQELARDIAALPELRAACNDLLLFVLTHHPEASDAPFVWTARALMDRTSAGDPD